MLDVLVVLFAVLVLPSALYLVGARSRDVWGLVRKGELKTGPSLYRAAPMGVWARGSAPMSVRAAAFTSFLLGQMLIPGALAAVVGLIMLVGSLATNQPNLLLTVLSLSAPTGLIVAFRLLTVGLPLLQRRADAPDKARSAATWEIRHNGVLLGGLALSALGGHDREWIGCALIAGLALLAIAHGLLLRRAASTLEAYEAAQEELGAPGSVEGVPSFP